MILAVKCFLNVSEYVLKIVGIQWFGTMYFHMANSKYKTEIHMYIWHKEEKTIGDFINIIEHVLYVFVTLRYYDIGALKGGRKLSNLWWIFIEQYKSQIDIGKCDKYVEELQRNYNNTFLTSWQQSISQFIISTK